MPCHIPLPAQRSAAHTAHLRLGQLARQLLRLLLRLLRRSSLPRLRNAAARLLPRCRCCRGRRRSTGHCGVCRRRLRSGPQQDKLPHHLRLLSLQLLPVLIHLLQQLGQALALLRKRQGRPGRASC